LCLQIMRSVASRDTGQLEAAQQQAVERAEIIKELLESEWIAVTYR
jgi:hypothetical protein